MPELRGTRGLADRALEEAMALLSEVRFDTVRGSYRQGDLTAVSVMVDSESSPGICHIRLMCHDPGHLGIEWDGIPIVLRELQAGEVGTSKEHVWFLDSRGRTEFRLETHDDSTFEFSEVGLLGLTSVPVPASMLGDGQMAPADAPPPEWNIEGTSPDGALRAQVEALGRGRLEITVHANVTQFPTLRYAKVHVVLRPRSNLSEIWLQTTISLEGEDGAAGSCREEVEIPGLEGRAADAVLVVFAGLK